MRAEWIQFFSVSSATLQLCDLKCHNRSDSRWRNRLVAKGFLPVARFHVVKGFGEPDAKQSILAAWCNTTCVSRGSINHCGGAKRWRENEIFNKDLQSWFGFGFGFLGSWVWVWVWVWVLGFGLSMFVFRFHTRQTKTKLHLIYFCFMQLILFTFDIFSFSPV